MHLVIKVDGSIPQERYIEAIQQGVSGHEYLHIFLMWDHLHVYSDLEITDPGILELAIEGAIRNLIR